MQKQLKKNRQHIEEDVLLDVNMTPLIDVMLVLIIMLIISIPIQQHAIDMNNPSSSSRTLQSQPQITAIDIFEQGQLRWNGQVLTMIELENNFQNVVLKEVQDDIHIHAEPSTDYKHVVNVLAAAQRQGVTKIGIYE